MYSVFFSTLFIILTASRNYGIAFPIGTEGDKSFKISFIPVHYDIQIRMVTAGSMSQSGTFNNNTWKEETAPSKVTIIGRIKLVNDSDDPVIYLKTEATLGKIRKERISVRDGLGNDIVIRSIIQDGNKNLTVIKLNPDVNTFKDGDEVRVSLEYTLRIQPLLQYDYKSRKESRSMIKSDNYETESGKMISYYSTVYPATSYTPQLFPSVYEGQDDDVSPVFFSTFQLTVIHFRAENFSCLSNTPLQASIPDPDQPLHWTQDKFKKTPKMTVNSVAFILSKFDFVERIVEKTGTVVKIHAPKFILDKYGRGNLTAEAASTLVGFFSDYFNGSQSPPEKVDIVWTSRNPSMVKPGLVSYSGGDMFPNIQRDFLDGKSWNHPVWTERRHFQQILLKMVGPLLLQWWLPFTTALHEHHHTRRKWSNLSAMATGALKEKEQLRFLYIFLNDLGIERLSSGSFLWEGTPQLRTMCSQEFGLDTEHFFDNKVLCDQALVEDGSRYHFSVLRMLADDSILGREPVRRAILSFRKKLTVAGEKSQVDDDTSKELFVESLQLEADKKLIMNNVPLEDILYSWDEQVASEWVWNEAKQVLVVKVDIVNATHLSFTQERLRGRLSEDGDPSNNATWYLPVTVTVQHDTDINSKSTKQFQFWLNDASNPVILPFNHVNCTWILVNPNSTSIHRTLYNSALLKKLQLQLEKDHEVFTPLARMRLMNDYLYFLHLNSSFEHFEDEGKLDRNIFEELSVPEVLGLTRYVNKETNLLVWVKLLDSLNYLSFSHGTYKLSWINSGYLYPPHKLVHELKNYLRPKLELVLQSINISSTLRGDPKSLLTLEAQILFRACRLGNPTCLHYAKRILTEWRNSPDLFTFKERLPVIQDLLAVIIFGGERTAFNFINEKFLQNPKTCLREPYKRHKVLTALAQSKDYELLQQLLNMTMDNFDAKNSCGGLGSPEQDLEFVAGRLSLTLDGVELYRKFFYERCEEIGEKLRITPNLFPSIFTPGQFKELDHFIKSHPICLSHISKERLKLELEGRRENMERFREWMDRTGNEIFHWFSKNTISK